MSSFPTDFDASTTKIGADLFASQADKEFLARLESAGFELHAGLTEAAASQLTKMALEPAIQEYCPNDSGSRFIDIDATRQWLQKGRAVFLVMKKQGTALQLAGYGWTGSGTTALIASGRTTFAIRVGELGQGKGLATPFARLIISASAVRNQAKDFWLETWASNAAAVHVYHKIGFVDVAQEMSERPSTKEGSLSDTRIYMTLSNDKL